MASAAAIKRVETAPTPGTYFSRNVVGKVDALAEKIREMRELLAEKAIEFDSKDEEFARPYNDAFDVVEELVTQIDFDPSDLLVAFYQKERMIKSEAITLSDITKKWKRQIPVISPEVSRLEVALFGAIDRLAMYMRDRRFRLMALHAELYPSKTTSIVGVPFDFRSHLPKE